MIKLEHCVLPSPEQMEFIIEGMRNPKNSWDRSDSETYAAIGKFNLSNCEEISITDFLLGKNDHELMSCLAKAGTEHRKYMRMMPVYVRITAPLYWWKEFDTYKIGTVRNSCSTMHKITEKEFALDDFSTEHLIKGALLPFKKEIGFLNELRNWFLKYDHMNDSDKSHFDSMIKSKKDIWWQLIQLLPSSYNQTANVMLNYEVLCDIYRQRKNHKLDEWREFCEFIEHLPYSELITYRPTIKDKVKDFMEYLKRKAKKDSREDYISWIDDCWEEEFEKFENECA